MLGFRGWNSLAASPRPLLSHVAVELALDNPTDTERIAPPEVEELVLRLEDIVHDRDLEGIAEAANLLPDGRYASPSRMAMAEASARSCTWSFWRMLRTWVFTVSAATFSSAAISRFERPLGRCSSTRISIKVRP